MLTTAVLAALLTSPPNVVLILADDQSYQDFGFMGNDVVHTPHIDRLAAGSAVYPNGYVPMSVCRPSLATILTGLYPHQHGVHFNHPPPGLKTMREMTAAQYRAARATAEGLIGDRPTLPRLLAQHGYVSLQTGKHWEGDYANVGFTHGMTTGLPADRSDPILGTRPQSNGELVAHGNGDHGLVIGRETMQPISDFLDEYAGEQPFMIWYAPFLPHTPFDAGPEFYEPYQSRNVPKHLQPYYAEITRFDATVGELIHQIEHRGLASNTIFVFLCDNGFRPSATNPSRQDKQSKLSVGEDGLRTPVLIRWDGRTKHQTHPNLVRAVDVLPTVLDAVSESSAIPVDVRGISLLPSATGTAILPDHPAFGAIYPNDATVLHDPSAHVRGRWIRHGRWKLITPGSGPNPLPAALYDLKTDPSESQNLIKNTDHGEVIKTLTAKLNNWWTPDK